MTRVPPEHTFNLSRGPKSGQSRPKKLAIAGLGAAWRPQPSVRHAAADQPSEATEAPRPWFQSAFQQPQACPTPLNRPCRHRRE
jgi:hypothetical protein